MSHAPAIPFGATAFVAMSADQPPVWTLRYAFAGEDHTTYRPRIAHTPTFTLLVEADRFLTCLETGTRYEYPPGKV